MSESDPDRYVRDLTNEQMAAITWRVDQLPLWHTVKPPTELDLPRFREFVAGAVVIWWNYSTGPRSRRTPNVLWEDGKPETKWLWPLPFANSGVSMLDDPAALVAWAQQTVHGQPEPRDMQTRAAWLAALVESYRAENASPAPEADHE